MTARICFLGDTLLGGAAQPLIDKYGYDYPLARIRHLWAEADLVVANHEAPLTKETRPAAKKDTGKKRYWYKGDPESAQTLAAHGVGVVSLANNHVADFGTGGVLDTMTALDAAGIVHCGAGWDNEVARRPAVVTVSDLRIGFLSVMQRYQTYIDEDLYANPGHAGPAVLDVGSLTAEIVDLREQVDLCVVLVHWGRNYRPITELQERLAPALVDAGADLVVGHHPHIPHPVRRVEGVPVFFSLGNGAFGTPGRFHSGRPPYGLVATVEADRHSITALDVRLIHVDNAAVNYQPIPVDNGEFLAGILTC